MEYLKQKSGDWLLKNTESHLKAFLVPKVPKWLETYHLTMLTLLWSFLVIVFFYLGQNNIQYIYWVPTLVVLQYFTDLLDGEIGRQRNTGLITWGYYVDHLLDFVFMSSIIAGYAIILGFDVWIFILYSIAAGFHVNAYLLVSADQQFRISFMRIGPTEARVLFIIFHLFITYVNIYILDLLLPYFVTMAGLVFVMVFVINQHNLWKKDLLNRKK